MYEGLYLIYRASDKNDHQPTPGSIAELFWDPGWKSPIENLGTYTSIEGGWRFLRLRTDKLTPNDIRVVTSINDSVANGCTEEEVSLVVLANNDIAC